MNAVRIPATLALMLASMLILSVATVHADGDEDEGGARRAPMPAIYVDECGACHAPYPASGLPAPSWRTLMTTLDRHFGNDAALAPKEAAIIRDWLLANAGRRAADPAAPLRITRTAWFLREHDEVPASVWRSQAVGTAANCGGCHRGAGRGDFSEHDVRLPRAPTPRPSTGAKR